MGKNEEDDSVLIWITELWEGHSAGPVNRNAISLFFHKELAVDEGANQLRALVASRHIDMPYRLDPDVWRTLPFDVKVMVLANKLPGNIFCTIRTRTVIEQL